MKAEPERLAERAAAEGLLDVAYANVDSPFGPLLVATTPRGLVSVSLPAYDPEETLEELAARISPRVLEAPARLDEVRRQLDLYFEGRLREFDLPLDWRLSKGFRLRALRAIDRIPYGKTRSYTADRTQRRQRARRPRRRHRLRLQPDPDRRPLPPRAAQRRRPRRLRRRPADEGSPARDGGRAGQARLIRLKGVAVAGVDGTADDATSKLAPSSRDPAAPRPALLPRVRSRRRTQRDAARRLRIAFEEGPNSKPKKKAKKKNPPKKNAKKPKKNSKKANSAEQKSNEDLRTKPAQAQRARPRRHPPRRVPRAHLPRPAPSPARRATASKLTIRYTTFEPTGSNDRATAAAPHTSGR